MGILKAGILGNVTGKIGGAVATNWKGKNVVRSYAKPANPQTEAQTTQRTKFSFTVAFAQTILTSIIHKFWYNLNSGMSEFNSFMKKNITLTDETDGITTANFVSVGSLEGSTFDPGTVQYGAGDVFADFSTSISGNGLATDNAVLVVYDKANNVSFISDGLRTRSDGSISVTVGTGRTTTDLIAFLFFYRGSSQPYTISQSIASDVTDA